MGFPPNRRRIAARLVRFVVPGLLAGGLLVAGSTLAGGSALSATLGAGEGPDRQVDAQAALERANESFRAAADALAEQISTRADASRAASEETLQGLARQNTRRFRLRAEARIAELGGDGALEASELSRALGSLRRDLLADLEDAMNAAAVGAAPPPRREAEVPFHVFAVRLVEYTVLERNPARSWLWLLGCVVTGLAVAGGLSILLHGAGSRSRRRGRRLIASFLTSMIGPLYLSASMIGVAAGLRWLWLPAEAADFVWLVVRLHFALAALWLLWNLCGDLASLVGWAAERTRNRIDDQMVGLVRKGLRVFAIIVFALFGAELLFERDVSGLLAGLGLVGIAVSLAAQDTLKNLIGSATIHGDRPFAVGDLVRFRSFFGTVEEVGFRSTRLRTLDGELVSIPNAEIVREPVTNVSARPGLRRRFRLDLVYHTPADRIGEALEILREILEGDDGVSQERGPELHFEDFGEHSLRILVEYHTRTADFWEAQAVHSRINRAVLGRYEEAGLEFAFPTRTVQVDHGPSDSEPHRG